MISPGFAFKFVARLAIQSGDLMALRCLDGLIFGFGLGFGLISSLFIQEDVIFGGLVARRRGTK